MLDLQIVLVVLLDIVEGGVESSIGRVTSRGLTLTIVLGLRLGHSLQARFQPSEAHAARGDLYAIQFRDSLEVDLSVRSYNVSRWARAVHFRNGFYQCRPVENGGG